MLVDMQNPRPKPIDEAAIQGFKITEKIEQLLAKCETEIRRDAPTIGVADTQDEGGVMFVHKILEERNEKEDELDKLITGLQASDPSTWQAQIDFGLASAALGGWTPRSPPMSFSAPVVWRPRTSPSARFQANKKAVHRFGPCDIISCSL
jgi:hypothetical protein